MPTEFDIIRQYFTLDESRTDVILGIGDDAAILEAPYQKQLVQSVDTLVAGVHFPLETSAEDIAYKALAVNLSDMAAMGAEPAWFTLAITLPSDDEYWLKTFSQSLSLLAKKYNVQLIGGDTTHGPLSISICITGFVEKAKALTRYTAQPGDKLYVSGTIGDAALGLAAWQGQCLLKVETVEYLNNKLNRPTPQVELGLLLRDYATSCIDVSDGLVADLGHIVELSQLGAIIYFDSIPLSDEFKNNLTDQTLSIPLVLSGGDDYQLCFTIPAHKEQQFLEKIKLNGFDVTCIGEMTQIPGIKCLLNDSEVDIKEMGYQHF